MIRGKTVRSTIRVLMTCAFCILAVIKGISQGTVTDYKRALALDTLYKGKVSNAPSRFHWISGEPYCWYKNTSESGDQYLLVDVLATSQSEAFDHQRMADALAKLLSKPFVATELVLEDLTFDLDSGIARFQIDSVSISMDLLTYEGDVTETINRKSRNRRGYWGNRSDELEGDPVASPDKQWVAKIKEYNVVVVNKQTNEEVQLSYDGTEGNYYSSFIKWSPDSRRLVTNRVNPSAKNKIYFVESSPENQLQPKLQEREYLKPGDQMTQRYPQLFDVVQRKQLEVSTEELEDQFSLHAVAWQKDGSGFTFEYNQRGHQQYGVFFVDTLGTSKMVVDEKSPTFIDYSGKRYRYDAEPTNEIIWASERDGWNHLYLYDSRTGKVKNQITKGKWIVRGVVHVDEAKREIIFKASGLDKDQDPYFIHYCKIGFDGKGFTRLTKENGTHEAAFSDDFGYFIDRYSRIDQAPVVVVKSAKDGKELLPLQKANIDQLEATGWKAPEVFVSKARDGKTDIWGMIIRPSNFDPEKTYPVIEYIYAGPHSSFVPKDFRTYLWSMHAMAELGFVVVQIDGMGTSNRSKAFHDVCYQNLKDAGFPDRKLWIQAAAKKYTYMDAERVGIFGTSAGGQSAAGALVFHSDFYDVAVSSCGCHDNRMDKIWWNEQWMGKIGPHYAESSNTVNAAQMDGDLMLILGELDDNVDPATTMQLVDALVKANKRFELVVIPGAGHTSGGAYGERKRKDFFVKHLMGVDPPSWAEVYTD